MSIYATTDLHGRKDLYVKIKSMLQPKDKVIFLGDAGDRGPDGWELIKAIYEDEQFVYIKGNHEDMLVDAMRSYIKNPGYETRECKLLKRNGGEKTIEDWWKDGANEEWIDKLDTLPLHVEYKNQNGILVLMSHAGYTPWYDEDRPENVVIPNEFDLLWNRDHFFEDWNDECHQNCVVVHGHTTIPSLMRHLCVNEETVKYGAYWYENNKKVCIDNFSVWSGIACLLNLDTLEEIIVEI